MINHRLLLRKCIVIIVVFVITFVSLHLKGQSKNSNFLQQTSESSIIRSHINRRLSQSTNDSKQLKSNKSNITIEKPNVEKHHKNVKNSSKEKDEFTQKQSPKISVSSTKSPKIKSLLPIIKNKIKKDSCTKPAFREFPPDFFNQKSRRRGAIIFHVAIVIYMFYCLAIVCDHYFLPSLEQCSQRLKLSDDVAGATFMAAGSSAPELFTAILGVFIAKGDVGTGTIVGSAVFNILFVIGLCALFTKSTQLNWWPVARDCSYYTFVVLVLILFIYDGEVTTYESLTLLILYGVYIGIMSFNDALREFVLQQWITYGNHSAEELDNLKCKSEAVHYHSFPDDDRFGQKVGTKPKITIYEAAHLVIVHHKRLFRPLTRFRSAAYLIILRRQKSKSAQQQQRQLHFSEPEKNNVNFAKSFDSMRRASIVDEDIWRRIPDPNVEGWHIWARWAVIAPLHAVLFYTIPNCKVKPHLFLVTFFMSVIWTAIFSYVMVWMVTLIGYTLGIPDSVMGITFLAAGTSVPDAYASIHVAKQGQGDMAVSNSIGSNVFDILVGLALPWFLKTAIFGPGNVATINSYGLVYAVILLFLSLLITIFLFHRFHWTLNPQLGTALLITYGLFLVFSVGLEFNLLGPVNPPMC